MNSRLTRRAAITGLASVGFAAGTSRALASPAVAPIQSHPPARRPTAFVQFVLAGGMDAILTTDPKERAQVAPNVDLPYRPEDVVRQGRVALGPLLRGLADMVPGLTILNGVQVSTVAHASGHLQTQQLRRLFCANSPGLSEIVGAKIRGDAPLNSVWIRGKLPGVSQLPQGKTLVLDLGDNGILPELNRLSGEPATIRALADVMRARQDDDSTGREFHSAVASLLQKWPASTNDTSTHLENSRFLREILFLLENNFARSFYVRFPASLDTHSENLKGQTESFEYVVPRLAYFMAELQKRKGPDGMPLAAQTVVIISSELGRFPVLNNFQGKDHFPEAPFLLMGPGLRPGQFGDTDKMMASQPIALATGLPAHSSRDIIPTLDDMGVTMLRLFGVEDTVGLGYFGRQLDFLLA